MKQVTRPRLAWLWNRLAPRVAQWEEFPVWHGKSLQKELRVVKQPKAARLNDLASAPAPSADRI